METDKKLPKANKTELLPTDSMSTNADNTIMTTTINTTNEVATPSVDELDYNQEIKSYRIWDLARELEREVARLRELLNRAIEIADESWDAEGYVPMEFEDRLQAIKDELVRFAPTPEEPENDWKCPHCGSTSGTYFSRIEPMGDICEDCGINVDDEPFTKELVIGEIIKDLNKIGDGNKGSVDFRWAMLKTAYAIEYLRDEIQKLKTQTHYHHESYCRKCKEPK